MEENKKLKLVRERNRKIFEEIKKGVTPIKESAPKPQETKEQEIARIIEDIFGDE